MRELVVRGLTGQNLRALRQLAETQFRREPLARSTVAAILKALADEYEDFDAVPTERFQRVNDVIREPLLAAIDACDSGSTSRILAAVEVLQAAFESLS